MSMQPTIVFDHTTSAQLTLVRSFEVSLADSWDGRTLDTRIVPYNEPALVADAPDFRPYREAFLRGAFERQLSTPGRDRVWLNVEHEQGFRGAIGRSLRFDDQQDGLHGSFGVLENADGDKALDLIRDGFLTGLSLEFKALSSRRVNGVVERVRAQLDAVSLCRYPAYEAAQVLAVREEPGQPEEPMLPRLERSADVDERLAAAKWEPLGEPMGEAALAAAAAALLRGRGDLAARAAEARRLRRHYTKAGMEPPASLLKLARSG